MCQSPVMSIHKHTHPQTKALLGSLSTPHPTHLIKFLEVILGSRIAPPTKLLPVIKMPLHEGHLMMALRELGGTGSLAAGRFVQPRNPHHAAPMTDSPTQREIPRLLQKYGEMFLNKKMR